MIEKYFVKGLTYTWVMPLAVTPPLANQTGQIVRSGLNAPPPLTFTGAGPYLPYTSTLMPPAMGNVVVPHRWLNYIHGQTAFVGAVNADVLTGPMSGCWICAWTQPGHTRHVGHIGTVDRAAPNAPPNTTVKHAFLNSPAALPASNLIGYSPAAAWPPGEIGAIQAQSKNCISFSYKIVSLVTATNQFYSILLCKHDYPNVTTAWFCGGIKHVPPTQRAGVILALQ